MTIKIEALGFVFLSDRMFDGSRHNCRERRGIHMCTHLRTHKNTHQDKETEIFRLAVCARIHRQTPLGCRPQECSRLSKREMGRGGVGGLKQTEPQLVCIPNGAPGSPT